MQYQSQAVQHSLMAADIMQQPSSICVGNACPVCATNIGSQTVIHDQTSMAIARQRKAFSRNVLVDPRSSQT